MPGLRVEVAYALALGLVTAALSEALSWLLVYRTTHYQRLKEELDRTSRKLQALKASGAGSSGGAAATDAKSRKVKKEQRLEENVKSTGRDLNAVRMKTGFVVAVLSFAMWHIVNTSFDGMVMARLPFKPLTIFTRMTHAGVTGDDTTEAGGTFLYILSMIACRALLQQLMGQQPSRAAVKITQAPPAWADPKKMR